jgi:hypothetical protein
VVAGIDKLVGKRSRSAFLKELAQREIEIRRQRGYMASSAASRSMPSHRFSSRMFSSKLC